jgi:hypothetical protein
MKWVFDEFQERVEETNKYFDFITIVESHNSTIADLKSDGSLIDVYKFDLDLTRILKANAFLLLYNLVESTVINGIFEIFNSIKNEGVSYQKISTELKKVWLEMKLNYDKKIAKETMVNQIILLFEDIMDLAIVEIEKKQIKFQGNLDADRIFTLAKMYGITNHPTYRQDTIGEAFKEIRLKRNSLAHGDLTFKECGKDFTIQQITEYKNHIVGYLDLTLKNIEVYITNKEFLCA